MLDRQSAQPHIETALERLKIARDRWPPLCEAILGASMIAMFRPPESGSRLSPRDITAAIRKIETGLRLAAEGLRTLDAARATTGPNAGRRAEALAQVQTCILGSLANSVARKLKGSTVSADQIADAMPRYGFVSFENDWSDVFDDPAARAATLGKSFGTKDFKAPTRDTEEWFMRSIARLAEIYTETTGEPARAYSRGGDSQIASWKPPFVQFVEDVWPLFGHAGEPPPSGATIKRALANACILPPAGTLE